MLRCLCSHLSHSDWLYEVAELILTHQNTFLKFYVAGSSKNDPFVKVITSCKSQVHVLCESHSALPLDTHPPSVNKVIRIQLNFAERALTPSLSLTLSLSLSPTQPHPQAGLKSGEQCPCSLVCTQEINKISKALRYDNI